MDGPDPLRCYPPPPQAKQATRLGPSLSFSGLRGTALSPDALFATVEGSATGIPMEQLMKVDPPPQTIQGAHIPSTAQVFSATGVAAGTSRATAFSASVAREVSSLPEGEAVFQWPATLSPDSVRDLEDWLGLLIRKLKRRYAATE